MLFNNALLSKHLQSHGSFQYASLHATSFPAERRRSSTRGPGLDRVIVRLRILLQSRNAGTAEVILGEPATLPKPVRQLLWPPHAEFFTYHTRVVKVRGVCVPSLPGAMAHRPDNQPSQQLWVESGQVPPPLEGAHAEHRGLRRRT